MISKWARQCIAMGERTRGMFFLYLYWIDAEVISATDQRGSDVKVSNRVFTENNSSQKNSFGKI